MFDICLILQILPLVTERIGCLLITSGFFQDKRKYSACDQKCRYCVFTLWGRHTEHYCNSGVDLTEEAWYGEELFGSLIKCGASILHPGHHSYCKVEL